MTETNYVAGDKTHKLDEQEVKPQRPMSIQEYTKALKAEYEVARLRAGIAKFMFEEIAATTQVNQIRAGQHAMQQQNMQYQTPPSINEDSESTNEPSTEVDEQESV